MLLRLLVRGHMNVDRALLHLMQSRLRLCVSFVILKSNSLLTLNDILSMS